MALPVLVLLSALYASDLELTWPQTIAQGESPVIWVTPMRAVQVLAVECIAGDQTFTWEMSDLPAGRGQRFEWARDPRVTSAECTVQARYTDDTADGLVAELGYTYGDPLRVDLSDARVDLRDHTITVRVTSRVAGAVIVAFGVGRAELARQRVSVDAGPGEITLPWVGEPSEVVLLDVTLEAGAAWASFTFSPWILDIPHDDVHFATDSDDIAMDEVWKLEQTLARLHEVVGRYGTMVPVKLFVAGCTDTVGDARHNLDLSRRRARSIALWLKAHGFDHPIFFHGFGEGLLAVDTPDDVDQVANRRALYIVAAHPPPASDIVPAVDWAPL